MTGKLKLYYGLLVLGLVAVGGGSWGLLTSPPKIEIPEGTPVVAMELDFVMRGQFDKLYLYDNGAVLYVEEKNLREPSREYPPIRVWSKGEIPVEELNSLIRLFQTAEFAGMNDYYQFSGIPMQPIKGAPAGGFSVGDGTFKFTIDSGDLQKTVAALGYVTPDHGLTYPDMPYPLNEIYQKLKQVMINNTKEVYSEPIQS